MGAFLSSLLRLSPEQTQRFRNNRIYGLLLEKILSATSTNQFTGSRFLEDITAVTIWMLLGNLDTAAAMKERQQLLTLLQVMTTRDSCRFHNPSLQQFVLQACGTEKEGPTMLTWFYREYCMRWIEQCLTTNNRMLSKESVFFFFELLVQLAKSEEMIVRVTTMMVLFPTLLFSDEVYNGCDELRTRAKELIVKLLKEGYVMIIIINHHSSFIIHYSLFIIQYSIIIIQYSIINHSSSRHLSLVLRTYTQYMNKVNRDEVLYILDQLIRLIRLPYPKEDLEMALHLLVYAAPTLASSYDNKQKLFFLEFVEKCMDLSSQGLVEEKLMKEVVEAVSNVQYIVLLVYLKATGCN